MEEGWAMENEIEELDPDLEDDPEEKPPAPEEESEEVEEDPQIAGRMVRATLVPFRGCAGGGLYCEACVANVDRISWISLRWKGLETSTFSWLFLFCGSRGTFLVLFGFVWVCLGFVWGLFWVCLVLFGFVWFGLGFVWDLFWVCLGFVLFCFLPSGGDAASLPSEVVLRDLLMQEESYDQHLWRALRDLFRDLPWVLPRNLRRDLLRDHLWDRKMIVLWIIRRAAWECSLGISSGSHYGSRWGSR